MVRLALTLQLTLVAAILAILPLGLVGQRHHTLAQQAMTWYVDDDLQDYADASFAQIQDAVDASSPGDTIVVCPGNYSETDFVVQREREVVIEKGAVLTTRSVLLHERAHLVMRGSLYWWQAIDLAGEGASISMEGGAMIEDASPLQPRNIFPPGGHPNVSLTPTLQSSAFCDPDSDDTHAASQWQITAISGNHSTPVFGSGIDTRNLTSIVVPSVNWGYSTTYYWRVRYQDSHGAWSLWSTETVFATLAWPGEKYAPTLRFDDEEKYFPTDVHGDDSDVTDNHENYDAGKFGRTLVCYCHDVTYDSFVVYEYWYYYAYNAFPLLGNHEHDFEAAFVWVDNTGRPFHLALTQHQWTNEYQVSETSQLTAYVELGGHGMADNSLQMSGQGDGLVVSGKNFSYQPIEVLESHAGVDLDSEGRYRTDEIGMSHVKAPWQRAEYADPEGAIRLTVGLGETRWISVKLHSPGELRVLDPQERVTGLVDGETRSEIPNSTYYGNAVIILLPGDSYRYQVVGIDEGSYSLGVTSVNDQGTASFAATDIYTSPKRVHEYAIDWEALSRDERGVSIQVDTDGDGTFEKTVTASRELTQDEFVSALEGKAGLHFWVWIVVGVGAVIVLVVGVVIRHRLARVRV